MNKFWILYIFLGYRLTKFPAVVSSGVFSLNRESWALT